MSNIFNERKTVKNTQWTRAYHKATGRDAWFLEQRWDSRQFWYPTVDYVAWLEKKMSRLEVKKVAKKLKTQEG